jgi:L-alanine-DL-glutamate epimerase-like enolase superfamily enzyme
MAGADPATLKIKRIETHVLKIGSRRDIVCVRIETAEGIHGWGEGATPPTVQPVVAQIRSFEKLLAGQSAWDVEKLWRRMYILEENTLGGTLFAAMSAIDIALWDILGKKLNVPAYKLLGGKIHDRLRIYTSYRWGEIPRTAAAYRKRTEELIAQGATAGKYDPFGPYLGPGRQLSTAILNEVREMIRGIREGGPSFDICVEAHGKWNIATAGRIIKMLEPFDPFFLEEPVPPEDVDAMAALQRSTNIPIATGEGLQSHWNFPGAAQQASGPHHSTGRGQDGRHHVDEEDRRDGRRQLRHRGAPQSQRPRLYRGQHACRHVDSKFRDHGGRRQRYQPIQGHLCGRVESEPGVLGSAGKPRPGSGLLA